MRCSSRLGLRVFGCLAQARLAGLQSRKATPRSTWPGLPRSLESKASQDWARDPLGEIVGLFDTKPFGARVRLTRNPRSRIIWATR